MDGRILFHLLKKHIPEDQFYVLDGEVVFIDPDRNFKPAGVNESPYDTKENRAIVSDVLIHYDILEQEFLAEEQKQKDNDKIHAKLGDIDARSVRSIREWIAQQPTAPKFVKDYETQAQTERAKLK